jgi:hypothetical protein
LLDETNGAVYEFGDQDAPLSDVPEKGFEFELATHLENLPPKSADDIYVFSQTEVSRSSCGSNIGSYGSNTRK